MAIVLVCIFAMLASFVLIICQTQVNRKKTKRKQVAEVNESAAQAFNDYSQYSYSLSERIRYILIASAVLFSIGYIFFRSIIICCILTVFSPFYLKFKKKSLIKKRLNKLIVQFKDALYSISSSIQAGKSPEWAFKDSARDLRILYPRQDTDIILELELISRKLDLNETLISALDDFAIRSGAEDIRNFADVFTICKNTGGNLSDVIKNSYTIINQKIDIKNEIQVIISEQKLSQKILNFVPFGLLILLSSSSPDYIEPLYSPAGKFVMVIVLLLLCVSNIVSTKITNIEV